MRYKNTGKHKEIWKMNALFALWSLIACDFQPPRHKDGITIRSWIK
jgi:hypothetical protein